MADYTESASLGIGCAATVDRDCAYGRKTTSAGAAIDVGHAATDRGSSLPLYSAPTYYTVVTGNNPANATGTITSVSAYFATAAAGNSIKVGTFRAVGDTLTCISAEAVGEASVGLNTWNGLSLAVTAGDYIGVDARAAQAVAIDVGFDFSGGIQVWGATGQLCDPLDSAEFASLADSAASLYGTGASSEQAAIIVGFAATVNRGFDKTSALTTGCAATVSRAVTFGRSVANVLGMTVSISKAFPDHLATLNMGFSVSAEKHLRALIAYVKGTVKNLHKVVASVKHLHTAKGDEH